MKALLTAILALTLIPFASSASSADEAADHHHKDAKHEHHKDAKHEHHKAKHEGHKEDHKEDHKDAAAK